MYLVSAESFRKITASKNVPSKIKQRRKLPSPQSDYDKWIKMSEKLREDDVTRQAQLKEIAKFIKQVLPEPTVQRFKTRDRITSSVKQRVVESLPSAAAESTPK
jgi:hypothetical protein